MDLGAGRPPPSINDILIVARVPKELEPEPALAGLIVAGVWPTPRKTGKTLSAPSCAYIEASPLSGFMKISFA